MQKVVCKIEILKPRTLEELVSDLREIANNIESGGVQGFPARLMFGPRALNFSIEPKGE